MPFSHIASPVSLTASRKALWQPIVFVAGLLALIALVAGLSTLSYQRYHSEAYANASNLAEVFREAIEETISRAESDMRGFADFLRADDLTGGLPKPRRDEIEALMNSHLRNFHTISNYRIFNASGATVLGAGKTPAVSFNVSDRAWFRALKDDPARALVISDVIIGKGLDVPIIIIAVPVLAPGGAFLGAVNAALDLVQFQHLIDTPEIGSKGMIAVRRSDTSRLLLRRPERGGEINKPVASALASRIQSGETSGVTDFVFPVDNVARTTAFRRAHQYPLVVTVGLARDDYLHPWVIQTLVAWNVTLAFVILLGVMFFRQRRTQQRLEEARSESQWQARRYEVLLVAAIDGICGVDADGCITFINPAAQRMLGWGNNEVAGSNFHTLAHHHHAHANGTEFPAFDCTLHKALSNSEVGNADAKGQYLDDLYWRKDGTSFQVEYTVANIRGGGRASGAMIVFRDVTERKRMEEKVHHLAFYDALTNLPNRRLLNDRLSQTMAASKRSGCHGAIMFLDLDKFKPLNDQHGHAVGDLLLIEVAERLRSCVREMDTVARYGGDEFVVMISELDVDKAESIAQTSVIAEKILASLYRPYLLDIEHPGSARTCIEHHCTASIGVALFIDHKASQDEILKRADTAMFQAKEAGRNTISFHDSMD